MNDRSVEDALVRDAWRVREAAYAPYSQFRVGAAVRASSGQNYSGANVENASFGLTVCAERAAIFAAISAGERKLDLLAVVTDAPAVTPPCGACRQVIWEFAKEGTIVAENRRGDRRRWKIQELLPEAFDLTGS
ncbi:MAG TPA: cytidine deaminase [Chloroflexota bacterium]|nr:cytidine deaminase [Chloroflexota bacterium]